MAAAFCPENGDIACKRCHGEKFVYVRLRDLSGKSNTPGGVEHCIVCPGCNGKGFLTEADVRAYYDSIRG